jgi:hypothetical protein
MSEPRRIVIELDDGPDPIAGRVRAPGGVDRRFEGYTQLVAALEATRAVAAGETKDGDPT